MIWHIVTGDMAAAPLNAAIEQSGVDDKVIVIKDVLSVGPLQKAEGQKFSEMRSAFWNDVINHEKTPVEADDMERLLQLTLDATKDETAQVWIWTAPSPSDMCTYLWTLKYLGKLRGRLYIVSIAGLPFLDENGKLFFPKGLGEVTAKEVIKARKLARLVTPAELELDSEEWERLVNENGGIRTLEGSKKIVSRSEEHYDNLLLAACNSQYQKASKVIHQAMTKTFIPTGDTYLGWRLRKMAEKGAIHMQGDVTKGLKDFEVKLNDGTLLL